MWYFPRKAFLSQNIYDSFVLKFIAKDFQKSPDLVTLIADFSRLRKRVLKTAQQL